MTLTEMKEELRQQGARYLAKAQDCTDEKTRRDLIAKAENTARYVDALNRATGVKL
jgi:NADP-dependent 3-hydroxy acid dehydrogenase YdfG